VRDGARKNIPLHVVASLLIGVFAQQAVEVVGGHALDRIFDAAVVAAGFDAVFTLCSRRGAGGAAREIRPGCSDIAATAHSPTNRWLNWSGLRTFRRRRGEPIDAQQEALSRMSVPGGAVFFMGELTVSCTVTWTIAAHRRAVHPMACERKRDGWLDVSDEPH